MQKWKTFNTFAGVIQLVYNTIYNKLTHETRKIRIALQGPRDKIRNHST